jgi:hypothetical protein
LSIQPLNGFIGLLGRYLLVRGDIKLLFDATPNALSSTLGIFFGRRMKVDVFLYKLLDFSSCRACCLTVDVREGIHRKDVVFQSRV